MNDDNLKYVGMVIFGVLTGVGFAMALTIAFGTHEEIPCETYKNRTADSIPVRCLSHFNVTLSK